MSEGGEGVGADPFAAERAELAALRSLSRELTRKERARVRTLERQLAKGGEGDLLDERSELVGKLREAGFDNEQIRRWVVKLSSLPVSQQELVKIAEPGADAPAPISATRRQLTIMRHQLAHWWSHGKGFLRLIYGSSWLFLLWQAAMKSGLGVVGYVFGAIILALKLKAVIGEMDPKHLPLFHRTLNARQLLLRNLLHAIQQWHGVPPTADQHTSFRVDALRLIASLVRDHRSDLRGKRIFVSLLVRANDGVVVVARADDNRQVPMAYTAEQCSIAWTAFETGIPQVTGDIYADNPNTSPDKTYNSVLVLPIRLRDEVLGVVSIDSELKHHFHSCFDELQTLLAPYVQLIASSLIEGHDRSLMSPTTRHQLPAANEDE